MSENTNHENETALPTRPDGELCALCMEPLKDGQDISESPDGDRAHTSCVEKEAA